jgi:UDPglucose 6-dehydrogenase
VIIRTPYIAQAEVNVKNFGIIGQGFVGGALKEGMKHVFDIETYDIDPSKESTCSNVSELVDRVEKIIFVCLPTPMDSEGRCSTKIVEDSITEINDVCLRLQKKLIVVIKSTVEPGTTARLNRRYAGVTVAFNPEFLTEANAVEDFKAQTRIIVGAPRPASGIVKNLYLKAFPQTPIIKTSSTIAETVKYFTNCFLATKVSFANEMKQVCDGVGIDYDKVVEYALYDDRIGKSHLAVPGPDGSPGFGGHCFPKDLNAIRHLAESFGVDATILTAVWNKNLEVRSEEDRDWLHMKGRAVVD